MMVNNDEPMMATIDPGNNDKNDKKKVLFYSFPA